jgi:hypothetical protein
MLAIIQERGRATLEMATKKHYQQFLEMAEAYAWENMASYQEMALRGVDRVPIPSPH